jgi:hypothetical protein
MAGEVHKVVLVLGLAMEGGLDRPHRLVVLRAAVVVVVGIGEASQTRRRWSQLAGVCEEAVEGVLEIILVGRETWTDLVKIAFPFRNVGIRHLLEWDGETERGTGKGKGKGTGKEIGNARGTEVGIVTEEEELHDVHVHVHALRRGDGTQDTTDIVVAKPFLAKHLSLNIILFFACRTSLRHVCGI